MKNTNKGGTLKMEIFMMFIRAYLLKIIASFIMWFILKRVYKISKEENYYKLGRPLIEVCILSIASFLTIFLLIYMINSNVTSLDFLQLINFFFATIISLSLLIATIKLGTRTRTGYAKIILHKIPISNLNLLKLFASIIEN